MGSESPPRVWGDPDAPRALMLHSLFCDGSMFDGLRAELSASVRAYCPDFRGQGERHAEGGDLGVDSLADEVTTLLRDTIAEPVHLVGSSMGAYVGVRVATRAPELVASCTLVCATSGVEPEPARFADLCDALAADPRSASDRIERTMFGRTFLTSPATEPVRDRWRRSFQNLSPRVADAARAVFARTDMRAELRRLPVPALLVAGGEDRAKRPADMTEIAGLVPGSRVVVIPHAGHTPAIETPAELARHLSDWWSTGPSPRGTRTETRGTT